MLHMLVFPDHRVEFPECYRTCEDAHVACWLDGIEKCGISLLGRRQLGFYEHHSQEEYESTQPFLVPSIW